MVEERKQNFFVKLAGKFLTMSCFFVHLHFRFRTIGIIDKLKALSK